MPRPSSVATSGSSKSSTSTTGLGFSGLPAPGRSPDAMSSAAWSASGSPKTSNCAVSNESDRTPTVMPEPSTPRGRRSTRSCWTPWLVTAPTCVRARTACITAPTPGAVATDATLSSATKPVSSPARYCASRATVCRPRSWRCCCVSARPAPGARRTSTSTRPSESRIASLFWTSRGPEPSPALGAGGGDTRRARPFPRFPGRGSFAPAAPGAPRATRPTQTPTTDQQPRRERVAMHIPPKISIAARRRAAGLGRSSSSRHGVSSPPPRGLTAAGTRGTVGG